MSPRFARRGADRAAAPAPLVVYHHIPKTAGASLRAVVKVNYAPHEMAESYGGPLLPEWYRSWWGTFSDRERDGLRCVAGHTVNALLPVLDRPFRAFCVVRHPLDYVLSTRDYMLHRTEINAREMPARQGPGSWGAPGVLARTGWSIEDIYSELGPGGEDSSKVHAWMAPFFDGQSRLLAGAWPELALPTSYDPSARADREAALRALLPRMARDYTVGVQDRMERSVMRFARDFGWRRVFLPRHNASSRRQRTDDLTPAVRERILAHNQLDLALYEHYARELDELPLGSRPLRARISPMAASRR